MWDISIHGDWLEREEFTFINGQLYNYKQIWQIFIGNNGENQVAEIPSLDDEKKKFRINYAEHQYTVFESLICLPIIIHDLNNINFQNQLRNKIEYLRVQNLILSFQAHSGRIRDNIEQCYLNILKLSDFLDSEINSFQDIDGSKKIIVEKELTRFSKLYLQRHTFIHGKKVPFRFDEIGSILLPIIRDDKNNDKGWDKMMIWDENTSTEIPIVEYCSTLSYQLIAEANIAFGNLLNRIKDFLTKKNLKMNNPPEKPKPQYVIMPSGSSNR